VLRERDLEPLGMFELSSIGLPILVAGLLYVILFARRLLPNRLVETDGPSGLIATLNEQPEPNRYVLHLLFYIPERRGQAFDTIEEVIPLHDVTVTLNLPGSVNAARCVPEETPIPMERDGDRVRFTVPRLDGHQMIELTA